MEYLIIIAVIALALAPLSHFAPSKRQRSVARMRESAALRGLFVEFRQLPGRMGSAAGGSAPSTDGVIYYGKRLPPARGVVPTRGSWTRYESQWRSSRGIDKPPDILARFPDAVLAASVDEGSCGIYWKESGSPEELDQIMGIIEDWAISLRPVPD